ncbi:MAG: hypothetical protein ACLR06_08055 [Christensenellaceae bacterium]|jgi:hypothetical protein
MKNQKTDQSYESFVLRLISNEELDFKYKDILYSIIHNPPYVYLGINVTFDNKEYKTEKVERYLSIFELLDQFRIDGKRIREFWEDVRIE